MKKIILFSILFFAAGTMFSQKIILHRNSGGNQVLYSSSIDSITFLPFACGDEIRYEGKTYGTVLIGTQCWIKENLDVGTLISGNLDQTNNAIIEKYCYNNDTANCSVYGGLYQWQEAMKYVSIPGVQGICPEGWHLPTEVEFNDFYSAVGGDGNSIKAVGQGYGSGAGTNTTGFSALLGGNRETNGSFIHLGYRGHFWSSTLLSLDYIYRIFLWDDRPDISPFSSPIATYGFNVRCIKD